MTYYLRNSLRVGEDKFLATTWNINLEYYIDMH